MTGGLPASPPAGIRDKAVDAAWESQNLIPGPLYTFPRSAARTTVAAVLAAIWPDLVALVAARDTDETTEDAVWEARQQAIRECAEDLTKALGYTGEHPWTWLIEMAELKSAIVERRRAGS